MNRFFLSFCVVFFLLVDCMFMYVTLHVASVPNSLGLTADSHPASEN